MYGSFDAKDIKCGNGPIADSGMTSRVNHWIERRVEGTCLSRRTGLRGHFPRECRDPPDLTLLLYARFRVGFTKQGVRVYSGVNHVYSRVTSCSVSPTIYSSVNRLHEIKFVSKLQRENLSDKLRSKLSSQCACASDVVITARRLQMTFEDDSSDV